MAPGAVSSSGAYERCVRIGGEEYGHVIDPRTGRPARTDVLGATVWTRTALLGDVLSTVLYLLGREALEKYAGDIGGVDMGAFKKALDDRTHKPKIEKDMADGKKAGISGTPGFVVNGYFISGAQPYGAFKKAIKLAKKEL